MGVGGTLRGGRGWSWHPGSVSPQDAPAREDAAGGPHQNCEPHWLLLLTNHQSRVFCYSSRKRTETAPVITALEHLRRKDRRAQLPSPNLGPLWRSRSRETWEGGGRRTLATLWAARRGTQRAQPARDKACPEDRSQPVCAPMAGAGQHSRHEKWRVQTGPPLRPWTSYSHRRGPPP